MELSKIQYIRKNGRKKGKKRGVMFCGVDSENSDSVVFGFSLCNTSCDRYDYVKGEREPGFGLDVAKIRAEKWKNHIGFFVQKTYTQEEIRDTNRFSFFKNPNPKEIIEIPPSVYRQLVGFIQRCRRYYQDKDFPEWIENIELSKPVEADLVEVGFDEAIINMD